MGFLLIICTTLASDNQLTENSLSSSTIISLQIGMHHISTCKLVKTEAVSNQLEQKDHGAIEPVTLDHHGLSPPSGWMCCMCPDRSESDALLRQHSGWLSSASGWSSHCTEAWPWIKPLILHVWQTVFKDLSIWIFKPMALFPLQIICQGKKNYVWKIMFICPKGC